MYPDTLETLYESWYGDNPAEYEPLDPFDGQRYGYTRQDVGFTLWSSGPDWQGGTDGDLWVDATDFR